MDSNHNFRASGRASGRGSGCQKIIGKIGLGLRATRYDPTSKVWGFDPTSKVQRKGAYGAAILLLCGIVLVRKLKKNRS